MSHRGSRPSDEAERQMKLDAKFAEELRKVCLRVYGKERMKFFVELMAEASAFRKMAEQLEIDPMEMAEAVNAGEFELGELGSLNFESQN